MNRSPAVLPEESFQQVGTGILCHPGILYHCPHTYQHKRSHQIQHGEDQYPEQEIEHVVGHHHDEHKVQHEVSIGHRLFGPQHMDLEVYQVHGQHNHQGQDIQEEDNQAPEPQDDHQVVAVSLHGAGGELSQSGTTQHQLQQGHHSQSCCVVHSLPVFCSSYVEVIGSNMGSPFMIRVEELGDNTEELVENIEGATPRAARKLYVDKVATDSIRTSWTVASTAGDSCKASAEFRENGSVDLSSTHNKQDDESLVVLAFPMASVETLAQALSSENHTLQTKEVQQGPCVVNTSTKPTQTVLPEVFKTHSEVVVTLSVESNSIRVTQQYNGENDHRGELHQDCLDPRQGHQSIQHQPGIQRKMSSRSI